MFLISVQWLSFLILEINFFANITIVVTHSEVVELWRVGVMCGEMEWCMEKWGEAHERALCAQAFSRAWDLISALCRYSHFLATFKWNFVNLFPQSVLLMLPFVFVWHQAGMAGMAVLADPAPEAAVSLILGSRRRAAVLSCAFWSGLLYTHVICTRLGFFAF